MLRKGAQIIYGTAWKQQQTAELVVKAIQHGFRAIDTACQPRHYHETGVGEALAHVKTHLGINRHELFVQTKFTPVSGHDYRIPYDPHAPIEEQVRQSLSVSLKNLQTSYVDSLILHSPFSNFDETLRAWRAMEELVRLEQVHKLGISNCYDLQTLQNLYYRAAVRPQIVQNRFYEDTGYDLELRHWCKNVGIRYQSFWTLTANPHILSSALVLRYASLYNRSPAQILFRYLTFRDVDPLTGTKSDVHMSQDLDILSFTLDETDLKALDTLFV